MVERSSVPGLVLWARARCESEEREGVKWRSLFIFRRTAVDTYP